MVQQLPDYAGLQILELLVRDKTSWLACRISCKMYAHFGKSVLQERLLKLIPHDRVTDTGIAWYAKVLAATSEKGDTANIQCFLKGLESPAGHTQIACLSYLTKVTPSGDALVSQALMAYIDKRKSAQCHWCCFDRDFCLLHAFEALRKTVDPDDSQAMRFLVDNIFFAFVEDTGRDSCEERRHMPVVDALVELGKAGDRDIVNILAVRLETTRASTSGPQINVLSAVGKLTNKGNATIINSLLRLFSFAEYENDCSIMNAVEATLLEVVHTCDRSAIPELLNLFLEKRWRDAFRAVTRATRGDYVYKIKFDWEDYTEEEKDDDNDDSEGNSRKHTDTFMDHFARNSTEEIQ